MNAPKIPVIVGVGDFKNRSQKVEDALEPAALILKAIEIAIKDTNINDPSKLQSAIDSVDVVLTWTWPYPDLAGLIAEKLGVLAKHKFTSPHGGNQPCTLLDDAARRISRGKAKVAVITGGEALASLSACAAAKKLPPPGWTKPARNVDSVFSPTTRDFGKNVGARHNLGAPIQIYPLYENGYRAKRGQGIQENVTESAKLYAEWAKVSEKHPAAWNYGQPAATEEFIATPSKKNRMICTPYTLLECAFNTINLAGAAILTSTEYAKELGIPEDRWIYPLGGAGTADADNFWDRPNFYTSPAIERSLDASLKVSGTSKSDIDLYDFYSCFPIVPKLAAAHLNLPLHNPPKPLTLLGGLTSFGGAGNNYSMHAITEMTRQLRGDTTHPLTKPQRKPKNGLILANGGFLTKQFVAILSTSPRIDGSAYPEANPLPDYVTDLPVPGVEEDPRGEALVETYTVDYSRDGKPVLGHVVGRLLEDGKRFIANHGDEATLREMVHEVKEVVGRRGTVGPAEEKGRSLFWFDGRNCVKL